MSRRSVWQEAFAPLYLCLNTEAQSIDAIQGDDDYTPLLILRSNDVQGCILTLHKMLFDNVDKSRQYDLPHPRQTREKIPGSVCCISGRHIVQTFGETLQ